MPNDPVPEADAQEQATPVIPSGPGDVGDLDPEVPEADAIEQTQPARPGADEPDPAHLGIRADVPEADALDQARPALVSDEEDEDL